MNKSILIFSFILFVFCGKSQLNYSFTNSGGSYTGEKWVNITTGNNGSGTVVWAQGNGTLCNSSGLLTNQTIDLDSYQGQTLYLNCYDTYADGWDGTKYELDDQNGTLVINNGNVSPNNGADEGSCKLESSESFTVNSTSPTIATSGTFSAFSSCTGLVSAEQSFTVSGTILDANISISAPTGYEISTTSGSGFGSSLTLTESGGTVSSTTIYTRLKSDASNGASGNVSLSSTNATSVNLATGAGLSLIHI